MLGKAFSIRGKINIDPSKSFYLWNRFIEKLKRQYSDFPYTLYSVYLLSTSYITMYYVLCTFVTTNVDTLLLTEGRALFRFLLVLGFCSEYHITFGHHLCRFFWVCSFLLSSFLLFFPSSFVLITFTVLKYLLVSCFVPCLLAGICLKFLIVILWL
jgi:hypothetical protein